MLDTNYRILIIMILATFFLQIYYLRVTCRLLQIKIFFQSVS